MKRTLLLTMLFMLVLAYTASAAIIHGTIYDFDLNKVEKAVVEIDTEPMQRMVAVNGTYSFEVDPGIYTITVYQLIDEYENQTASENVDIPKQGRFMLDLFIFPTIEEDLIEDDIFEELEPTAEEKTSFSTIVRWIVFIIIVTFVVIVFFYQLRFVKRMRRKIKKEETKIQKEIKNGENKTPEEIKEELDDYTKKILDFIKKEDGRTTQKEIRKEIPLSEAKISLIISELEHKGKVEKIKKGRGNIIVLK